MIKLKIDKERNLILNMEAIDFVEETTGKPIGAIDWENPTQKIVAIVLQACMSVEDSSISKMTYKEVIKMIDQNDCYNECLNALNQVMEEFGKRRGLPEKN